MEPHQPRTRHRGPPARLSLCRVLFQAQRMVWETQQALPSTASTGKLSMQLEYRGLRQSHYDNQHPLLTCVHTASGHTPVVL